MPQVFTIVPSHYISSSYCQITVNSVIHNNAPLQLEWFVKLYSAQKCSWGTKNVLFQNWTYNTSQICRFEATSSKN